MVRSAPRRGSLLILVALAAIALVVPPAASAATKPADDRVKSIVTFDGPPGKAGERLIEKYGGNVRAQLELVDGISALIPRGQLKQLAKEPGVQSVQLDGKLTAFDHGPDTHDLEYENAWGVEHIGTPAVHAAGVKGAGVKVAVIDSGLDYIHDDPDDVPFVVDPEFLNIYKGGHDFVNSDDDPMDDNGHGTHVAGILAAEKNGYLVSGVAPEVDLYALKILDANGTGDESNLILALQWAIDNDIDVVNMSLGTHTNLAAMQTAVENAAAAGVLLVAASGNINPLDFNEIVFGCAVAYPAAYPQVLSTTFTNGNNALTGWSCTGPEVDFASPGDQITSPVPIGPCLICAPEGYSVQSGTSMASPHLAGTVALLLDAGITDAGTPGLFDDVKAQLCSAADVGFGVNSTPIPVGDPRYPRYFGCGVLDADGAVLPIVAPPVNTPPVAVDDSISVAEDAAPTNVAVLANDTDVNGQSLTVSAVTDPPHGTASIIGNTTVAYTPDASYSGPDSFDYTVSDGAGGSDSGHVSVTVTPVDDPPTAQPKTATTTSPNPVTITLTGSDPDTCQLTFQVVDLPDHGGVGSLVSQACVAGSPNTDSATVVYTPTAGYSGPDTFTYRVLDATSASAPVAVSITVNAAPPPSTMHVGDLDGTASSSGKNWTAKVTIQVDTDAEASVSGVVVTGSWSDGASGTDTCTTNGTGVCTIASAKLSKAAVASATFTITGLVKAGVSYDSTANHDLDGDSTAGTSITVLQPL